MQTPSKKYRALWLCSWYPDIEQPQNGDFIQRQALAVAKFAEVNVVHAIPVRPELLSSLVEIQNNKIGALTETRIYYRKKKQTLHSRILSFLHYFKYYKKYIDDYIAANGKPDIVHLHIVKRDGIMALYIKRRYKIPFIVTEHASYYEQPDGWDTSSLWDKYWMRRVFAECAYFLPVSEHLYQTVAKKIFPVKYKVVPNVINSDLFYPVSRNTEQDRFTLIHVSSMSPVKNPDEIIAAFADFHQLFPNTALLMVGQLSEEVRRRNEANGTHLSGIRFIPMITQDKAAKLMQESHALILNSSFETFSCVLAEAWQCGLPVITTRVGIASEILNVQNGIAVPFHNIAALTEAMKRLYLNRNKYDKWKISSQLEGKFSPHVVGMLICDIYRDVIASGANLNN